MHTHRKSLTKRIAVCGIFSSLALLVLLAGNLIPLAVYLCPILAGLLLCPAAAEYGRRNGLLCYLCVSLLGLLVLPDKEALFLFIALLGYYPLCKPTADRIKSVFFRVICKLLWFNGTVLGAYWCMLHLFRMHSLSQELQGYTRPLILALILLANLTFLLYDVALARAGLFYRRIILPRIRKTLK